MEIYNKLNFIQQQLKAPKDLFNSLGGYKYRSCESILEAIKPLLAETKTVLMITDNVEAIGGRVYVKATATLVDVAKPGDYVSVSAFAREEESKKGMDGSQVTGATSSYARKYALNGLFCIDDNKDADATNTHGKEDKSASVNKQPESDGTYIPTCVACRASITEAEHNYSVKIYKKPLCRACQDKAKKA